MSPSLPAPARTPGDPGGPQILEDGANTRAAHPMTPLLQTLPRVATGSLAALIAEIGPLLEPCQNPEQVAAMCDAAPVTRASGK